MKLLILLCLSTTVLGCGIHLPKPHRHPRMIIGGKNVTAPGKWPWQVLLYFNYFNKAANATACGGTIIGSQWVLTAAHCVRNVNTSEMAMLAGGNRAIDVEEHNMRKIIASTIHPQHNRTYKTNDIAILKLAEPLQFSDVVAPICLPNPSQSIPDDGQATVIGFGKHDVKGTNEIVEDGQLRETVVPIVAPEVCEEKWSHTVPLEHESNFINLVWRKMNVVCASSIDHGTHEGDSGGPLMMKARDGRWFQIGIASFMHYKFADGQRDDGIRGDLFPKTFADVRKHCDWIKKTTEGEVSCEEEEVTLENAQD